MNKEKLIRIVIGALKSRTVWLNIIGFLLFFMDQATGKLIDPVTAGKVIAGLNIVNRFITTKALDKK